MGYVVDRAVESAHADIGAAVCYSDVNLVEDEEVAKVFVEVGEEVGFVFVFEAAVVVDVEFEIEVVVAVVELELVTAVAFAAEEEAVAAMMMADEVIAERQQVH